MLKTRNENYENRSRECFVDQEYMAFLGAELQDVGPGSVEIHLPYRKSLTQQNGYFHGGAIGSLADVAGGFAAFTLMAENQGVLTVEYKVNFMAPAIGEFLIARGRVIRAGRLVSICQSDIFSLKNGVEKHCATSLGTFMAAQMDTNTAAQEQTPA